MCLAHSRAEHGRLRHSSSSCKCPSPARSAFCFIGSSFGISYKKRRDRTLAVSPLSFYLHSIYPLSFSCQEDFLFLFLLFLSILLCRLFHAIAKCSEQLTQTIILSVHIYDRIGLFQCKSPFLIHIGIIYMNHFTSARKI